MSNTKLVPVQAKVPEDVRRRAKVLAAKQGKPMYTALAEIFMKGLEVLEAEQAQLEAAEQNHVVVELEEPSLNESMQDAVERDEDRNHLLAS